MAKGKRLDDEIVTDYVLGWQIVPFENPDGSILCYLQKLYKNRAVAKIIVSIKELKRLKKFMKNRKFS